MNTLSSTSWISLRYRQSFIDIDTSTLWRYRRYRYDIDKVLSISIQAHCDDIVDIVDIVTISTHISTISSILKRYRQGFVNIETSTLWRYRRYRRYRYDIDRFRQYRYIFLYYPTVDELKVQFWWLYVYPQLNAGSNFGQADKNKTIV